MFPFSVGFFDFAGGFGGFFGAGLHGWLLVVVPGGTGRKRENAA
jgi:hypothetical protein